MTTTVVAGNPKPGSRTLDAATRLAESLTGSAPDHVVDVIELGPGLLGWGDEKVKAAVETVASSDLVVFARPPFKATYTGVGLRDVTAVPLMLGAGPAHAMAPDLLLKPVLVELGAVCPVPGLYLIDSTYTEDTRIADYTERWASALPGNVSGA